MISSRYKRRLHGPHTQDRHEREPQRPQRPLRVAALASNSICCYHDGHETEDNVQGVLSYSAGRSFIFPSMTDNAKQGNQLWLYSTRVSLNVTLEEATFFYKLFDDTV